MAKKTKKETKVIDTYHSHCLTFRCGNCKYCAPRSPIHDDEFCCALVESDYFEVDANVGFCNLWRAHGINTPS